MGLSINQNIMAMNSYRNLSSTQTGLSKSLEKLSSGYRINRAADDAAGLAISEGLRTQVRGNTQAVRNAQDGISVVQTAEGALNEVHDILQRQRELAVQAANDSNNSEARSNIDAEMKQLNEELGRIAKSTNFNGTKLLDGSAGDNADGKLNFQVGSEGDSASRIVVDLSSANVKDLAAAQISGVNVDVAHDAVAQKLEISTSGVGSYMKLTDGTATSGEKTSVADAVADYNSQSNALYTASYDSTAQKITLTAKTAGANPAASTAVKLSHGNTSGTLGTDAASNEVTAGAAAGTTTQNATLDVSNHANAQATIEMLDKQIGAVSTARANLGAVQNRFEHTINNLNVAVENLSASESRIRDTDMASEMMKFTRNQILSQAGTSMLAQANQVPQGVLSLLR